MKEIEFNPETPRETLLHTDGDTAERSEEHAILSREVMDFALQRIRDRNPGREGMICGGCILTLLQNLFLEALLRTEVTPMQAAAVLAQGAESLEDRARKLALRHFASRIGADTDAIEIVLQ